MRPDGALQGGPRSKGLGKLTVNDCSNTGNDLAGKADGVDGDGGQGKGQGGEGRGGRGLTQEMGPPTKSIRRRRPPGGPYGRQTTLQGLRTDPAAHRGPPRNSNQAWNSSAMARPSVVSRHGSYPPRRFLGDARKKEGAPARNLTHVLLPWLRTSGAKGLYI